MRIPLITTQRAGAGALAVALIVATAPVAEAAGPANLPRSYHAPPAPSGTMADKASPMSSLTVVEGAFGMLDGQLVAYAAPMGENAQLNVSTLTGNPTQQLGRYSMPGASGAPTIAVGPDQKVYLGTYYEGHLYEFDPVTKTMSDLGKAPGGAEYLYGLSVAPDGTVYGGSFPGARVWAYKKGSGFTDLGKVVDHPDVKYARTVYDPDHNALYVGTQTVPRLFRIDLATRQTTEIALSAPPKPISSVSDLDYVDGRVFVNYGGFLRVVDAGTAKEIPVTDGDTGQATTDYSLNGRGVSAARKGGTFFSTSFGGSVWVARYDLATNTVRRTTHRATRGALIGYGWAVEDGHDILYAFAGNYSGGGLRYDIDANTSGSLQFQITAPPSPLQHVLPTADGSAVFVNAFQNGNTARYDVASGQTTAITRLGQVEDWTLVGDQLHAGTYPNGALTSVPVTAVAATPLTTYASLKEPHAQIRPIDVKVREDRIWYATAPDYGQRGGAVAILDPATKAVDVTRNIVPDHTIAAMAFLGSDVYLGSSTEAGTGTEPVPGNARLVQWDPTTKKVRRSLEPVAGASTINALTIHNGKLWGLAGTTLFVVNPATFTVERRVPLGVSGAVAAGTGELVFHPNGYLYAHVRDSVVVLDPLAYTTRTIAADTHRLELSADRSMWTLIRPQGSANYLDLGRYTPAATPCPNPDTREFVTVWGRPTKVRNRFVITGCTIQDLLPKSSADARAYGVAVNGWLDQQVASGAITREEKNQLAQAARR